MRVRARKDVAPRRLQVASRTSVALTVALEQIGAPAFMIGSRCELHETNTAARALQTARGRAVIARALADTLAHRKAAIDFELIDIREPGVPSHYLAIARLDPEAQITARVRAAGARWGLTARQLQVLELVTQGLPNATIATMLGIGARAIELHVTAIFDRAGVDSRVALVARVFMI